MDGGRVSGGRLADRVVLVTGASSGIGEGAALALAAEGATVVAAARRVDRLQALVERLRVAGGDGMAVTLDVLDDASIAHAMESIAAAYGRLHGLVNSAGVLGRGGALDPVASGWRSSIATNLLGPMLVTHAALPLLKASDCADVVNVSSTVTRGLGPNAGSAPYGAAKAGINAFSESLRKELAPLGIRITVVMPGLVESEFFTHAAGDVRRGWMKEIVPLQPADVAGAIVFALTQPPHVSINELVIRPTPQIG